MNRERSSRIVHLWGPSLDLDPEKRSEPVLFPAISWMRNSPLQNPKFPPEKHPKYKKH